MNSIDFEDIFKDTMYNFIRKNFIKACEISSLDIYQDVPKDILALLNI